MPDNDPHSTPAQRPPLVIGETDHARLSALTDRSVEHGSALVARLLDELTRAEIVPDDRLPADRVGMNSEVDFRDETSGQERTVRLVYPPDADISAGQVSILTPVGAALLGLSPGQCIDWPLPDGSLHRFRIIAVRR